MKAMFYEKRDDGRVKCRLCPHNCLITEGHAGICGARRNSNHDMEIPYFGRLSSLAVDPIEKKPLYHFYPASTVLSAGFWGCSFRCPFCQNYSISQNHDLHSDYFSPEELVQLAVRKKSFGIAYTYSEPLIHFEYILETGKIARKKGIKNILVSNGYINPEPADELLEYLDAANIDLKTFNSDFYRSEIGGKLEDVKRFIRQAAPRVSLEVTTLIIPSKNDTDEEISELAGFLAGISKDIPLHLSCYYPTYKYVIPPTSPELVERLGETAKKHLNYVYLGNVGLRETNTYCPGCGECLIRRSGYSVSLKGLEGNSCKKCGTKVPVVGI
ncbi:MAG: AmmeMemoRadiSam system radical SAM enzyme [Spirochaetales bacterium]|nr:AmmeMemoRadiSam system radical SAM enzyme [Spirochaetales bacterium]